MSRYKSKQTVYTPQKKKNIPIWKLDANIVNVTHFNADTLTEGKIIEYLDDLELKVGDAIARQVERWKKFDSCYQKAILSDDAEKMLGLENCFIGMAREIVFESMVYI